jgi:hypothetical protein
MGITRVSSLVQQPCFGLLRVNDKWHQVRVLRFIRERAGEMNEVRLPDGTTLEVRCDKLKFDRRIRHFVPHPEYAED